MFTLRNSFIGLLILSGCAHMTPLQTERVGPEVPGQPADLVADAMQLVPFHFAPDHIYRRIIKVLETKRGNAAVNDVKDEVCTGYTPNYIPTYKVKFIPSKPAYGTDLGSAQSALSKFYDLARSHLKNFFFDKISDFDLNNKVNPYLSNPSLGLSIPALLSKNSDEIQNYFAGIHYTPYIPSDTPMVGLARGDSYFSLLIGSSTSGLLVPKAGEMISVHTQPCAWNFNGNYCQTATTKETLMGGYDRIEVQGEFYTPSQTGWKVDGKTLYPLKLVYAWDLAFLRTYFTFKTEDQSTEWMIDARSSLWSKFFADHTTLKEAPQEDGSVNYEISLDLGEFCSKGVPITSLVSR